jgi:hypothetical protein
MKDLCGGKKAQLVNGETLSSIRIWFMFASRIYGQDYGTAYPARNSTEGALRKVILLLAGALDRICGEIVHRRRRRGATCPKMSPASGTGE